jgi:hypothetical protein
VLRGGVVVAAGITGTTYVDADLYPGTSYTYTVRATNGEGTSIDSNAASASTKPTAFVEVSRAGGTWTFQNVAPFAQLITYVGVDGYGNSQYAKLSSASTCISGHLLAAGGTCTVIATALADCIAYTVTATLSNAFGSTTSSGWTLVKNGKKCV